MSRLTEKYKDYYDLVGNGDDNVEVFSNNCENILNKLGKLEDLEEELGCPLVVIFKAITQGVYYEDVANCMRYMAVDLHLNLEGEYVLYFTDEEYLLTKNYKKTWWLKEDRWE